jgi:hypothetical protein
VEVVVMSQNSLLIAVMVALSVFPVSAFSQQQNPPQKSGLSGGATIQRQRIDRAIDTAKLMTVEEAIQSLNSYNESYELAHLSTLSPASLGICFMNSMRGDRRICKIFEHLLSLPSKEADKQAQSLFDNQFPLFLDEWRRFVRQGGLPKFGPHHHSLSAGLFFCSYFCTKDDLDSRIQKWNETLRQPEFEQSEGGKVLAPSRLIDPMFHLNLLAISGYRHQKSIAELNRDLETVCKKIEGEGKPFLQATQMSFYKSYAETTDTDFTHITRGAPASDTQLLLAIPGFSDPNASSRLQIPDRWDQCLAAVQAWRDR